MQSSQFIDDFDLETIEASTLKESMIAIKLPESYKIKYDMIQARSKKRYTEHLRRLVMAAIDRVDLESTKAC